MSGSRGRLEHAALRDGSWRVTGTGLAGPQDFISDEHGLFLVVHYARNSVKLAKLWDFSSLVVTHADGGVPFQQITPSDRDKATRVEDVLLGNSRRF